ncbi:hypothetical protein PV11_05161 [Exophiala sideris]|uniref:Uncharacterized protein n=1 Tax=Exophiala sideris TaxID=1016849 RepID=A0A0D1YJQ9_9EURO|nr:hypothetical protein PV11_05161 [Exophiala sideris]
MSRRLMAMLILYIPGAVELPDLLTVIIHDSKLEGADKTVGLCLRGAGVRRGRFAVEETQEYKLFAEQPNKKLVRVDHGGRIMWNWKSVRNLELLTTWTGSFRIENLFTADKIAGLLQKEVLLAFIVRSYCSVNAVEFPQTIDGQLALVLKGAPKLRALVVVLADVVVSLRTQRASVHYYSRPTSISCGYLAGATDKEFPLGGWDVAPAATAVRQRHFFWK